MSILEKVLSSEKGQARNNELTKSKITRERSYYNDRISFDLKSSFPYFKSGAYKSPPFERHRYLAGKKIDFDTW